jgi:hypothetical protein
MVTSMVYGDGCHGNFLKEVGKTVLAVMTPWLVPLWVARVRATSPKPQRTFVSRLRSITTLCVLQLEKGLVILHWIVLDCHSNDGIVLIKKLKNTYRYEEKAETRYDRVLKVDLVPARKVSLYLRVVTDQRHHTAESPTIWHRFVKQGNQRAVIMNYN